MRRSHAWVSIVSFLVWCSPVCLSSVAAAPSLNASGLRGGSSIDLGQLGADRPATEQVALQMTNDVAKQYRLVQSVPGPIVNERGTALRPDALVMEITGGNSGTVRVRGVFPVQAATTELFVSNPQGQSDQLTLLYSVPPTVSPEAGTYRGSITYTLELADGSASRTLTMPLQLRVSSVVGLQVAANSSPRVDFGSLEPGRRSQPKSVSFAVTLNAPGPVRVMQSLEAPLTNERGQTIGFDHVHMVTDGSQADRPVEPQMTLLSIDQPLGTQQPVQVTYTLDVPEGQQAGVYHTVATIALSGAVIAGGGGVVQVPLEVAVPSVLSMTVAPSAGQALALNFAHLVPGQTSPAQTLTVAIQSNIGQPYEVVQELARQLISDDGRQLPADALRFAGTGALVGVLAAPQLTSVPVGRSVVYRSDALGSQTSFSVAYQVQIPPDAAAGTYRSSLLYTVTPL